MEGVLARELVAELEGLTRAARGLVRLVAYLLEVEVPVIRLTTLHLRVHQQRVSAGGPAGRGAACARGDRPRSGRSL